MLKFKSDLILHLIISFIFLLYLTPFLYSQETSVITTETGFILKINVPQFKYRNIQKGNFNLRDYYEFTDEGSPVRLKLPKMTILLALPQGSKPVMELRNKVSHTEKFILIANNPKTYLDDTGNLSYEEMDFKNLSSIPSQKILDVRGYFYLRGIYCAALQINTHLYDVTTSSLEIIDKLEIQVTYSNSSLSPGIQAEDKLTGYDNIFRDAILNRELIPQFYSSPNQHFDSLYNWIDFNNTYLKIGAAEDGVYRLFKSDFEKYGVNTSSINPRTFKLMLKGKEIPVYVQGEGDGSFDESDFIEFYGTKNYAAGNYRIVNEHNEPYSEYIDRYSDTTIYWLTWDGTDGLRPDTSNQIMQGIQDTLRYYTNISHYEQNNFLDYFTSTVVEWQNPKWLYNESWIWGQQGVGTVNNPFIVSDIVIGEPAKAFWRVQSYASNLPGIQNAHNMGLSINNNLTIYDSGYIDKYEQKVLVAEFPSNLLQIGENILKTHSFPVPNVDINSLQVDWYEVEYPRYLVLINDSLKFKFNQSLSTSLKVIKLTGAFSSNYILYKISDYGRRVSNFSRSGSTLEFADTVKTGDEFFVITEGKVHSPKIYYKKQFENLVNPNNQADYIIISHPLLNSSINSYMNLIEGNYSVGAKNINVLDIYDQFNYGFFSPEPIREFLKQANQFWFDPKPSYLFLIGEANYDYHNYKQITPHVINLVPSFGHPVSDSWFAIWDSVVQIPQMFVGRLPANSEAEVLHYLNKHEKYLNDPFDMWNKSYFLLSGGSNESQKLIAKNINDNLRVNYIQNEPAGGYASQLYATENPKTNFGPFTQEYIDSVFNNGGIVVSYLGHSGTKIWDNGIENPDQLKNKYNKFSLINDFGCSTAKFAEFDIVSFSESFVNGLDGDAIAYQGNSSLGFTSTSYTFPQLYFEKLLKEKKYNIGEAHLSAKIKLLNDYGNSSSIRLFILCNTLIGDPLIELKIPAKPNLVIDAGNIKIPSFLDDNLDSIDIQVAFRNLGIVDSSQFDVRIEDRLNNQIVFENIIRKSLSLNNDNLNIALPVRNRRGEHNLQITLDVDNEVDEIYENDNATLVKFNVLTTSIRAIISDSIKVIDDGVVKFLNSVKKPSNDTLLIRLSSNPHFSGEQNYLIKFDTLGTTAAFANLENGKRYWYKTSFSSTPETIFETNSFIYKDTDTYNFAFADSNSVGGFKFDNMSVANGVVKLNDSFNNLTIRSAGFEAGGIAKIMLDNIDYAENAQGCGHHVVVIDEATKQFEQYRWFNFWNIPNNYEAYHDFLSTIPEGKLVAISIGGECGGYNTSQELKDILHQFGSVYIDSVGWGSSWILLGKLNTPMGSVPEAFSTTGPVEFDTSFISINNFGSFETNQIVNSGNWEKMSIEVDSIVNYFQIKIKPIIHLPLPDTLDESIWNNGDIDLSYLNSQDIDALSFNFLVEANPDGSSPIIKSVRIDYDLVPELATNYQVVSVSDDSVLIGEDIGLSFYVYNVGESKADSFNVMVEVINEDNSRQTIFEQKVDSLHYNNWRYFDFVYNTSSGSGAKTFLINIDPENQIRELFEDNNFFSVPFFIKPDTTKPVITLTIDGNDILDGEYISPTPVIHIELNDESLLPITDPSSVMVYLNDELIPADTSIINYQFSETNPKVTVDFNPALADGEYTLRVLWKDYEGNIVDSSGVEKFFLVSNEAKILNVYNYPNPSSGETHFTFKLTQIPEIIKIKIFTIAGRLVRDIKLTSAELKYDFNKIYWDGRDEDGDILANGVYLYKVIMKAGEKAEEVTQKLAIVK
jgi:Peptidase family C25/Interleukin-like EMT inducer/CARDB